MASCDVVDRILGSRRRSPIPSKYRPFQYYHARVLRKFCPGGGRVPGYRSQIGGYRQPVGRNESDCGQELGGGTPGRSASNGWGTAARERGYSKKRMTLLFWQTRERPVGWLKVGGWRPVARCRIADVACAFGGMRGWLGAGQVS
jgi:hypothetical protein